MEATKTKSALVMADGHEVKGSIDELRAHYDAGKAVEHFKSGALSTWLEERYYETAATKVRSLKEEYDRLTETSSTGSADFQIFKLMIPKDEDIASFLSDVLGISQAESKGRVSGRAAEKRACLQKRTDDEEILSHAGETAFTQEDMAELLDAGEKTIYLCGKEFEIPMRVGQTAYIGILGKPVAHVAAATPDDLRKRGISLSGVAIDYLEDETENFLDAIQKAALYDLAGTIEHDVLILYETDGNKSSIKESIRRAAEDTENSFIERMSSRIDSCLEQLEDIQDQYERMHEDRGIPARALQPDLQEVRDALAAGHERISKELAGKLAKLLLSRAQYETLEFNLFRGSSYLLDNANELDAVADQFREKYAAQYGKRDMDGVVQAYLRSVRRGVERLRDTAGTPRREESAEAI